MSNAAIRRWRRLGVLQSGLPIERFATAGLSADGRLCLTTDIDRVEFCVWDTEKQIQVWEADQAYINQYGSPIPQQATEFAQIMEGPTRGLYRIFGCNMEAALKEYGSQKIQLEDDYLVIIDSTANTI